MSLLQLRDAAANDASAKGDDYAKGSSSIVWASLIAFVVVSIGIALFLISSRKPPVAAGEVNQVYMHAVHQLNTPVDANGQEQPTELFDQVLVLAHVRVRNQSDEAIVLKELTTNVTLADGEHQSTVAGVSDYGRIFIAYPELAGLRGKPLERDTVIQPGQVLDGTTVSAFRVSKAQWEARKDMSFTLQFKYHPDLVLLPTGPIREQ
jgi:hypothetical protein